MASIELASTSLSLTMAIWSRRPDKGLIHHSDRGSQYASHAFRGLLAQHGFKGSMSRKGNCLDNSVAESFFGRLKQERVQLNQTRYQAQHTTRYFKLYRHVL